jgi:hypothetical protein
MKNFSDLLATDLYLDFKLTVEPVDTPDTEIWINQKLMYQGCLPEPITISEQLPLLSELSVLIKLKNKIYSLDSKSAIVINQLSIDGFNIVPMWTQLATYINDHHADSPTAYLGFNGDWKLEINQPFYQWRHQITGQGWLFHPCRLTETL